MQAAHLFADSSYPSVRHDIENGVLLCSSFHMLIDHNEAHKEEFRHRLLNEGRLGDLRRRALQPRFKWQIEGVEKSIDEMTGYLLLRGIPIPETKKLSVDTAPEA